MSGEAGKGDSLRPVNIKRWDAGWDAIRWRSKKKVKAAKRKR